MTPFALETLDGDRVRVPAGRPGAVLFTVSSCLSCIPPAQALADAKRRLSNIDVLLVSMDPNDSPDALRDQRGLIGDPPYPSAIDSTGTLATRYQVTALATTVIYDANGRIVERVIEPNADQLDDAFRKAGAS